VCRIKSLQHINDHTNNKCDKGLQSLYLWYLWGLQNGRMW